MTKILTGPADHCRNNYDAPGALPVAARLLRLLLRCRDKPRRPPRQETCIASFRHSRNFLEVSSRRTRNCFVGGEIQFFANLAARPARASGRCGSSSRKAPFRAMSKNLMQRPYRTCIAARKHFRACKHTAPSRRRHSCPRRIQPDFRVTPASFPKPCDLPEFAPQPSLAVKLLGLPRDLK